MLTSETTGAIALALSKAQGEITNAALDASNPGFKRGGKDAKYATLAAVWDACRSALAKNEIAVVQSPANGEGGEVTITTMLVHSSGEWMRGELTLKPSAPTPQGAGSAITYARRYSLAAMVGVAPDDDDDGNAASGASLSQTRTQPKQQAPTPKPSPAVEAPMFTLTNWENEIIPFRDDATYLEAIEDTLRSSKNEAESRAFAENNFEGFLKHVRNLDSLVKKDPKNEALQAAKLAFDNVYKIFYPYSIPPKG